MTENVWPTLWNYLQNLHEFVTLLPERTRASLCSLRQITDGFRTVLSEGLSKYPPPPPPRFTNLKPLKLWINLNETCSIQLETHFMTSTGWRHAILGKLKFQAKNKKVFDKIRFSFFFHLSSHRLIIFMRICMAFQELSLGGHRKEETVGVSIAVQLWICIAFST